MLLSAFDSIDNVDAKNAEKEKENLKDIKHSQKADLGSNQHRPQFRPESTLNQPQVDPEIVSKFAFWRVPRGLEGVPGSLGGSRDV